MNERPVDVVGSRTRRIVAGLVGFLFVALAVAILVVSSESTFVVSLLAALAVGGLGIDALVSATRGKRSLLSRIGPLP